MGEAGRGDGGGEVVLYGEWVVKGEGGQRGLRFGRGRAGGVWNGDGGVVEWVRG